MMNCDVVCNRIFCQFHGDLLSWNGPKIVLIEATGPGLCMSIQTNFWMWTEPGEGKQLWLRQLLWAIHKEGGSCELSGANTPWLGPKGSLVVYHSIHYSWVI